MNTVPGRPFVAYGICFVKVNPSGLLKWGYC
jgi:hypothetical protein